MDKPDLRIVDYPAPVHSGSGHRARLRQRLIEGKGHDLHDHEVIEYLLALAIPRRDTKALAKALLRRFGSLAALLTADVAALARVPGMGDTSVAAIKIAQLAGLRMVSERARELPVLSGWQALLDYLYADMAHLAVERVRVLYLNSRNMLVSDEIMSEGSVDEAAIHVREVIRRALDLGAVSLILVHNHPSGDPAPSKQDIAITRDIAEAGRRLNIAVHDHVIIGASGHASLRNLGLI